MTVHDYRRKDAATPEQLYADFAGFIAECRLILGDVPLVDIYCDSAEQTLIEGMRIDAAKRNLCVEIHNARKGPINDRIRFYTVMMGAGRYKILKGCTSTIDAFSEAMWDGRTMDEFYVRGLSAAKDNSTIGSKTPVPCFDFAEDEGYFYAAFMGAYGIDLRTAKLHWLDFCALFKGLPDDCKLRQIIGIRAQNLGEIKSGAERKRISKLKSIYGLKVKVKRRFEAAADRNAAIAADLKRRAEEAEKKMREVRK